MRKSALVLAAILAATFTVTGAEAAKKKAAAKPPADAAYEWNVKNVKSFGPNFTAPAAEPAKAVKTAKKKSKKKSKKA